MPGYSRGLGLRGRRGDRPQGEDLNIGVRVDSTMRSRSKRNRKRKGRKGGTFASGDFIKKGKGNHALTEKGGWGGDFRGGPG